VGVTDVRSQIQRPCYALGVVLSSTKKLQGILKVSYPGRRGKENGLIEKLTLTSTEMT